MGYDIAERLAVDPGQRTIGQLMTERAEALIEIRRLHAELERQAKYRSEAAPSKTATAIDPPRPLSGSPSPLAPKTLLRIRDICARLNISRTTIYQWIAAGRFPRPIHIGSRMARWPAETIDAWQWAAAAQEPPGSRGRSSRSRSGATA